jgi:hypothetical protein
MKNPIDEPLLSLSTFLLSHHRWLILSPLLTIPQCHGLSENHLMLPLVMYKGSHTVLFFPHGLPDCLFILPMSPFLLDIDLGTQ